MQVKVVLVGVEGAINLGFIVRLCRNFDVEELALVDPAVDPFSDEVRKFAANGAVFMDSGRLKVYKSLDDALAGVGLSACTSAVVDVDSGDMVRKAVDLEDFVNMAKSYSSIAVVFGRESVGLTREEISKCDLLVHIASNPEYPVLNLSHAVGITLYRLYRELGGKSVLDLAEKVDEKQLRIIDRYIDELVNLVASSDWHKQMMSIALKRFIRKAVSSKHELGLLTTFIRRVARRLKLETFEENHEEV
uniref:rRNA methyltransferase n=1 Tax=Ignisphaera aggregans TaxID=334771 RepID=A0A7C2VPC3_9CREN